MIKSIPGTAFMYAVGLATTRWAILESIIDLIISLTYSELGGHPKHPKIPRVLSSKVTYLRDMAEWDEFPHWRDRLVELADRVDDLKERRHDIVHGVVLGEPSYTDMKLFRIIYEKTHLRAPEDLKIRIADVAKLSDDTTSLGKDFTTLALELHARFEEVRNEATGE